MNKPHWRIGRTRENRSSLRAVRRNQCPVWREYGPRGRDLWRECPGGHGNLHTPAKPTRSAAARVHSVRRWSDMAAKASVASNESCHLGHCPGKHPASTRHWRHRITRSADLQGMALPQQQHQKCKRHRRQETPHSRTWNPARTIRIPSAQSALPPSCCQRILSNAAGDMPYGDPPRSHTIASEGGMSRIPPEERRCQSNIPQHT